MLQSNNVQRCYKITMCKGATQRTQVSVGSIADKCQRETAVSWSWWCSQWSWSWQWQGCVLENCVYFFVWTKNIFSGLLSFTYIKYFQCFWTMNIFSGLFSGWPLSWRLFGWVAFYTWDLEQTEYTRSICPFGLNICLPVFGRHLGFCIFVVTYCFFQCHQ